MSAELNKTAEGLFEKIRGRFSDISLGDQNAKATNNPEDARFYNFDFEINDNNYGNVTISLVDEDALKVYFSKNMSQDLAEEDKKEWYNFLRELRLFAKRNMLKFEPRDITRQTLQHRDLQQMSHADSTYTASDLTVTEARMYGSKKRSYESYGPVRIKVLHTKPVAEEVRGSRSRNIEALFVENDQGERFRLPFVNLAGARAMARHVSAGGIPTDELGEHITDLVNEMLTLRPFVHSMRTRTFEDENTQSMAESAYGYHKLLKDTLHKMKGKRGYSEYKESWTPQVTEEEVDVDSIKDLFVKRVMDERVEQALPLVHKAHKIMSEKKCKYSEDFEAWADKITEGTWHIPETEEDIKGLAELLRKPITCGVDGMDATNAVGKYIGDDVLYDDIEELAKVDPKADCNSLVVSWLDNNMPEVLDKIKELSPDGFVRDQGRQQEKPKDWAQAVAADESIEEDKEYECPTCQGAGEWRDEEHKKHDCPDCDGEGKYVDVDDLEEGKMKDLSMDLKDLSDKEFEEKYGMKKTDWDEVKTPGLRQDPSKPAYISKNLMKEGDDLYEAHEKLEKLVGQRVYVKDKGQTGTVAQVSNTHSNALVVDMDNGQTTVTHFTDLTSEDDKPNAVKRYLDMLKDVFDLHKGRGPTPKGGLPAKSWDTLGEEELADIKRLSGLK